MRRTLRMLFPVLLLLLALLTGCGREKTISGTITGVEASPAAVILRAADGKETAFLLDAKAWVLGWVEGESRETLRPDMRITVTYSGRRSSFTAADGTGYPCYTASLISIDEARDETPVILSDGTPVWLWRGSSADCYRLEDRTELIWWENAPGDLRTPQASEEVNEKIEDWFEARGLLYDPMAELNRAYAAYLENPDNFECFHVGQETCVSAAAEDVLYYRTSVFLPVEAREMTETLLCTAFDRETGAVIPVEELFTCGRDEILETIWTATGLEDQTLRQELKAAFRPEYLIFWPENLEASFPAGTLPSERNQMILSVDMADVTEILKSGAVPVPAE